jgi:putative transposase
MFELQRELNLLKQTDLVWLRAVSKCAPQEGLRDLERAFTNFFRSRARTRGKIFGFPRPRARKRGPGSCRFSGAIRIRQSAVRLPRIGWVRLEESDYLPIERAHIYSATISERAGRWFVSVCVAEDREIPTNRGGAVGVDLGISWLLVTSDDWRCANPRPLRRFSRKLSRLHRRLHRMKPHGRNRAKMANRVARLHRRIRNIRVDTMHKATTTLAKTKSVVAIEDLRAAAMRRSPYLGRSVKGFALGELRRQLEYKTKWYGGRLIVADRHFPSSKRCSSCGWTKPVMLLRERLFRCDACGAAIDRDLNAARNLLAVAARSAETKNVCRATSSDPQLPVGAEREEAGTALAETG